MQSRYGRRKGGRVRVREQMIRERLAQKGEG